MHGKDRTRRQYVDVPRLDIDTISRFDDRHLGGATEDLGKHAVAVGRQMSDDDKRQPVLGRDRLEEML
jgi:hypothetical protein